MWNSSSFSKRTEKPWVRKSYLKKVGLAKVV